MSHTYDDLDCDDDEDDNNDNDDMDDIHENHDNHDNDYNDDLGYDYREFLLMTLVTMILMSKTIICNLRNEDYRRM